MWRVLPWQLAWEALLRDLRDRNTLKSGTVVAQASACAVCFLEGSMSIKQAERPDRVCLRPMTRPMCHRFYQDFQNDPALGHYYEYIYSKETVDSYFDRNDTADRKLFAILVGEQIVGEIKLKDIDESKGECRMGIHLQNDAVKGKGYGTEAERLILKYAFENMGMQTVLADVAIQNARSQHVLEKVGFSYTHQDKTFRYYRATRDRKYYEAYDDRYRQVHGAGLQWFADSATPIVQEMLSKYRIGRDQVLLEIGCGEGRDAVALFNKGYNLLATDVSAEAIGYCQRKMPQYTRHFATLDCLKDSLDETFDFIFSVAVVHMLVPDRDRDGFYRFIHKHLMDDGLALICTMGDGETEMQSDISQAFALRERNHETGPVMVAATSCRMVSFDTFEAELRRNCFEILETGITSAIPDFNSLMYAVVKR